MDRRVQKTRKAIFEALTSLLAEKEFDAITVNDIASAADVNRVTVYKHFSHKYDVLDKCIDHHLAAFLADCGEGPMEEVTLHAFRYLKDERATFQRLLRAAGPGVLHEKFAASFRQREHRHGFARGETPLAAEIETQLLVSAVAGVFEWWLTAPEGYSAEEACNAFLSTLQKNFGSSGAGM